MFNRLKLIIQNKELEAENRELYEENKTLRADNEEQTLIILHSKALANKTLDALESLQEIDRKGIDEKAKVQLRNSIINNLRLKNIDIIKELSSDYQSNR